MAKVEDQASCDFWNCSRYVCACPFCDRSTLLCIVASAESTGANPAWPDPFIVAAAAMLAG